MPSPNNGVTINTKRNSAADAGSKWNPANTDAPTITTPVTISVAVMTNTRANITSKTVT